MTALEIRIQLEEDFSWRRDEIRVLKNQLAFIAREEVKKQFRKALVVMLYSHFEGFCKTALSIYAHAINQMAIKCAQAEWHIAASALAGEFDAYDDFDRKCKVFKKLLPDDTKLHRFSRRADLLQSLDDFTNKTVSIPIEAVVDVSDNLKPIVLRKILFRLGFDHEAFSAHDGQIHLLLERRNGIAHGARKAGLDETEYDDLETAVFAIMDGVIRLVVDAIQNRTYLRSSTTPP